VEEWKQPSSRAAESAGVPTQRRAIPAGEVCYTLQQLTGSTNTPIPQNIQAIGDAMRQKKKRDQNVFACESFVSPYLRFRVL